MDLLADTESPAAKRGLFRIEKGRFRGLGSRGERVRHGLGAGCLLLSGLYLRNYLEITEL